MIETNNTDEMLSFSLLTKLNEDDAKRLAITISCRDCDELPKVEDAGQYFGQNLQFQRMHNGVQIKRGSYHGAWMSEVIKSLRGHHEPQEEKVFAEVISQLESGAVMLELGSFWAYYSLWFQREIPNGVSIMLEPNANKIEVGKEHFHINNFEGTFIRGFVGDKSLPAAEFIDWDGTKSVIPQVSIDGLMQQLGLEEIDILHADVQGAEFDMLKGAANALEHNKINYLFISTHGHQHRRCKRQLDKYGYKVIAEHSVLQSYSGDGLIVAKSSLVKSPTNVLISKRKVSISKLIRYELAGLKQLLSSIFSK
jgi:FkbM family methyltransferase